VWDCRNQQYFEIFGWIMLNVIPFDNSYPCVTISSVSVWMLAAASGLLAEMCGLHMIAAMMCLCDHSGK